jgi:GNAT superfamily N-acetyltransferase
VPFDSPLVTQLLSGWDDELRARIPGFSSSGGSTVEAGDFELPRGVFLIAELDGAPMGCAGLRRLSDTVGEVKRVYVRSEQRRRGVARTLLGALEDRARSLGYDTLRLDTDGGERGAIALFRSLGYEPIDDYNRNPYARHWFEKRLDR